MDNTSLHTYGPATVANSGHSEPPPPPSVPSVRYFQIHFEFLAENLAEMRQEMAELRTRIDDLCALRPPDGGLSLRHGQPKEHRD